MYKAVGIFWKRRDVLLLPGQNNSLKTHFVSDNYVNAKQIDGKWKVVLLETSVEESHEKKSDI